MGCLSWVEVYGEWVKCNLWVLVVSRVFMVIVIVSVISNIMKVFVG